MDFAALLHRNFFFFKNKHNLLSPKWRQFNLKRPILRCENPFEAICFNHYLCLYGLYDNKTKSQLMQTNATILAYMFQSEQKIL